MATLEIDGGELIIRLGPWERLGSLRRDDLRIPRAAVASTQEVESAYAQVRGLRAPGTGVPRRLLLGTWRRRGAKDFVAVSGRGPGVVIELRDQPFDRVVVSGAVPDGLID